MKTLLLIRHAHTHMAGRFCGHSDPELSSIGCQQLSEIVGQVRRWPVSVVYASDLKRAAQTAEAIASPRELNVQLRPSLREIYFGDWEGRSWDEIEAADPALAASWLKAYPNNTPPGGETFHDFEQRVRDELAAVAVLIDSEVAAVTHAGFIRTAISLISGAPIRSITNLDYGSVTELRLVEQKWTVAEK
ncbi:MAG TPA: histidine phosphatase family protein [Candidatus Angelobacter sp.]|jgi:alpha-ribazole phosphatase/probable phosphoglycerate mutase|nr:histidine phosphatase family protein [Candidatus Angelobacter sp.]